MASSTLTWIVEKSCMSSWSCASYCYFENSSFTKRLKSKRSGVFSINSFLIISFNFN